MKNIFNKLSKIQKISLVASLSLTCIAAVGWKPLAISYGEWLAADDRNPQGDIAVLLSGDEDRLKTLISLYQQRKVNAIYYAGGVDETPAHLSAYRKIFDRADIPKHRLFCGGLAKSTYHEAQLFQRKLTQIPQPVKKIVLVSERYHLRRGIWSFQNVVGNDIQVSAYSTPSSAAVADRHWWEHDISRQWIFEETKKMIFYQVYYGLLANKSPLTHGDYQRITTGKTKVGIQNNCQIVLPQLNMMR